MKILSLRFKNLNSLEGEWKIDFTHPQYLSDGIFAIAGATGAGKSTILDAICLALYGKTPRLNVISTTTNEIMSRKTKECFAEVVFESKKGKFKSHWSQTKANRSLKLQTAKFELFDCASEKIIASKLKETSEAIEEKTGMDFNRFTQSMLLAQGGFAKFLQASGDERVPILEDITGTEIYRTISKNVFERNNNEKKVLDMLKSENAGFSKFILKEEELELLQTELSENRKNDKIYSDFTTKIDNEIKWLNAIETLTSEIKVLSQEQTTHNELLEAFLPERKMLNKANSAYELEAEYEKLNNHRNLLFNQEKERFEKKKFQPELLERLNKATLDAANAVEAYGKIKMGSDSEFELMKLVRELDLNIKNNSINLNASDQVLGNLGKKKEVAKKEIERLDKLVLLTKEQAKSAHKYIAENSQDESLVQKFEAIKISLEGFQDRKRSLEKYKSDIKSADTNLRNAVQAIENQNSMLKSAQDKYTRSKELVEAKRNEIKNLLQNRPLIEYKNDLDRLIEKQSLLNKITSLEAQRKSLEDGKECPLCGSEHHPYAEGNIPNVDETQKEILQIKRLILSIESIENELRTAEKAQTDSQLTCNKVENELSLAQNKQIEYKKEFERVVETEKEAQKELSALQINIQNTLNIWGLNVAADSNSITETLQTRLANWIKCLQITKDSESAISKLESEISTQKALFSSNDKSLAEEQLHNDTAKENLTILKDKRKNLYGEKDPETEEPKLKKAIENASEIERNASNLSSALKNELESLENRIKELEISISEQKPTLLEFETNFNKLLNQAEFVDEAEFISCRLEKIKRENLSNKAKALDERTAELITRKSDREKTLAEEQNKNLTETSLEILLLEQADIQTKASKIKERIGAITQDLQKNDQAQREMGEQLQKIEQQCLITKKWEALNNLIGQADGKKFSRFAQGITFEIMVSHANIQLAKLTDRYLLERDSKDPLELNVIDNYQAGESRSTKNLSGGESFIISLALALGLSSMSSKNVSIDSLFLDEGFGTLDEDTLETALNALASLRQDGKLIGVISHVGSLKERISAKIEVIKGTGGKSTLSGPGCSALN